MAQKETDPLRLLLTTVLLNLSASRLFWLNCVAERLAGSKGELWERAVKELLAENLATTKSTTEEQNKELSPEAKSKLEMSAEMFEVIVETQPEDVWSWMILRDDYLKLGKKEEALRASKGLAKAYMAYGQLSDAILEYEAILQACPGDHDIIKALDELTAKIY